MADAVTPGPSPASPAAADDPAVSIIVPAYKAAGFIGQALASVFAQTFTSYEVVVVNDRSPDTPALERALVPFRDRVTYLVRNENGGVAAARNTGIRVARGRYIALLDSDDTWEPDYLEEQVRILDADPSVAMVYPNALIVGDHPHEGRTYMEVCPSDGPVTIASLLTGRCNAFISAMVRRDAVLRAGLFDEDLRSVEDFEMWVRLLAAGERIRYHRKVLARYRKHPESLSADPVNMARHVLQVLEKMAKRLSLSEADRQVLTQRQAYFRAALDLALGKQAFFRLDRGAALEHIQRANEYFKSWRLRVVCAMIRTLPRTLLRLYQLRHRIPIKAATS